MNISIATMIKSRLFSIAYAVNGIKTAVKSETNMKIHLMAMLIVFSAALFFNVSEVHWMILLMCIGWVLMAEMFNTSIEVLCDYHTGERHPKIKRVKDVAAGAVLVSALVSFIIGLLIFYPYIQLHFM